MANSIKIGNSSISSIKLGSADVDAVYIGSTLVYSGGTTPPTPPTPTGDSYEQLSSGYSTSIAFQSIHIDLNNYYGEIWFASTADTTQIGLQAQWFITENGRYIQCGGTPDYYEISALTEVGTNVYEFTFPEPQYFVPQEIYQNTTFGNVSVLPIFSALTSGFSTTMAFETIRIDTNTIDTSNGASIYTSTVQGETSWTDNTYEIRLNLGIIEYNGANDHIDITAGTEISTGVYQHTFPQPLYFTADGSYEFNHPQFDLVRVSPANGVGGGGGSCSALSIDFSNEVPIYSIKIDLSNYPNGTIYFNTNSGQTNRDFFMDWRLDLGMGRIENDEQGVGIDIRMDCTNLGNDVYEWYCPTTLYFVACTFEYEMDNPDFSTVEVCQGCQTLDINTSNELAITSMTFDLSDSWELNSNKIYFNSDSGHTSSDNFMDWKVDLGLGRISNDEQGVAIYIRDDCTNLGNELYQWTCPTTLFFVSDGSYQFDTPNFDRVKICT